MPNENKELTHCPNCPRHCPREALSCERGIRFFDQDEPGDSGFGRGKDHHHGHHAEHHGGPSFFESESKNPLVLALSKASAIAETQKPDDACPWKRRRHYVLCPH